MHRTLRELAHDFGGYVQRDGDGNAEFHLPSEGKRVAFIKQANKILAGKMDAQTAVNETEASTTPAESNNFGKIDHKDGSETKPSAKILGSLDNKTVYPAVKSIAVRHGGEYKKAVRGFAFNTAAERDAFIKEADAYLGAKFSAEDGSKNSLEKEWENIEILPAEKLTEREKVIQDMGERINNYKQEIGRNDLTNEEVIEEMMADAMPIVAKRIKLFRELARENLPLYQRVIAWIKDKMDMLREMFHMAKYNSAQQSTRNRGLSTTQIDKNHTTIAAFRPEQE